MIERFHRQLKAALKSHHNPTDWSRSLPLVLLGIRSSLKEDLGCTAAELVYGTTLRLPGGYFSPTPTPNSLDATDYVQQLKFTMSKLRAVPPRLPSIQPFHVDPELDRQTHVFLRRDAVRTPLQSPYDGPYKVLNRTRKHFTLEIHGRHEIVFIDRLKAAHLDSTDTPDLPTTTTQSVTPLFRRISLSHPLHLQSRHAQDDVCISLTAFPCEPDIHVPCSGGEYCGRHVNLVYLSDFLKCLCFDLYMYCTTLSHLHLLLFYVCNSPSLYVAIFSHLNFSTCINTQPFSIKLFDSIFN